ncbi:glycerophosphoryl diester phosphodiesterase [Sphingomonas naasensis]|uniref:glycerophosphodiester phosphodiesterase n=1 Tax=Sphingomonas naasensis TaxID=1344951 RepID=A0A4S1WAY8_9SPHN|nr:glycerophosphodiester phosphodiesterase [Sphingomonas naasensis]NIJ19908.1 glycerophosphoryl diester phosphodiesterase [Sphingomonas naasensis]TGX39969.1 glycerophosphodiester phosphodiesterase [Sphingomonas naasensis]
MAVRSAPSPIVIAHRGASGERPEHTLLSYRLAIEQGADFIEPDLVPTKDGVLVARHENEISGTTDVANHAEFVARKTTKTIDGAAVTGWFTEDFTLAELKTLRARERLPQLRPGNTRFDGQAEIPTLDEIIALAKQASRETGRTIGIYPETKHPGYFASIGLPLEARLVAKLHAAGWDRADAPVFIQSFEVANLKALNSMTRVPLIQLMSASGRPADGAEPSYAAMATPEGLKRVAAYATGIGPERTMIVPPSGAATSLVADAHAVGLKVHPWTFRAENFFLLPAYRSGGAPGDHGRLAEEIAYFIGLGIDGFFSDYPYIGVSARDASASPAHRK